MTQILTEDLMMIDVAKILNYLEHRYPFLLVDRVSHIEPPNYLEAYKNVSFGDYFFQGHFPNKPIMPGVLILEAMAQASGLLLRMSEPGEDMSTFGDLLSSIDQAKFRHPVLPGDQLRLKIWHIKKRHKITFFEAEAWVDSRKVAQAHIQLSRRFS
jgi:3-hydroxyacyl-[acyl-carrier-protein] dehydratase